MESNDVEETLGLGTQQNKIAIKLIGEKHDGKADIAFVENAEKLASEGKIFLVRENIILEATGEEFILEGNTCGIEDKVIWEYNQVIMALRKGFQVLYRDPEMSGKCILEIVQEMQEFKCESVGIDGDRMKNFLIQRLTEYTESYVEFLCNNKENNPVSKILEKLFEAVIKKNCFNVSQDNPLQELYTSVSKRRSKKEYKVTKEEIALIRDNVYFFNKVLRLSAKLFSTYMKDGRYSERIKTHLGLSESWIDDYFSFKLILPENKTLLNFDLVCVDLRNQIFVERLLKISNKTTKDIWFVVGENHLSGLDKLFSSVESSNIKIQIFPRDKKEVLLQKEPNKKQIAPVNEAPGIAFYPEVDEQNSDVPPNETPINSLTK